MASVSDSDRGEWEKQAETDAYGRGFGDGPRTIRFRPSGVTGHSYARSSGSPLESEASATSASSIRTG